LRTDLGGLYFNAIVAVAMFGLWAAIGWDGLLLVIATQILQMIRQLPPMLRFDGYHLLADLTGVPDLYHRIKPTLASLWPTRWRSAEARALKPWARLVVTVWVLAVAPLLLLTALVVILTLPRILASAGHSIGTQWTLLGDRWTAHDWAGVGAKTLALFAVAVPAIGVIYMVSRLVRQIVTGTLRRTRGKPAQRTVAGVLAAAIVAGLAWAWWPRGNYRPIQPDERGVLQQVLTPAAGRAPLSQSSTVASYSPLREGQSVSATTVWPSNGAPLPRPGHPQLALVLRPRDPSRPTWVFPFNRPAPPGPGDNQAMAVTTKDGSTVYDVAFALVVAGKDTVLNKNEAYAFASCTGCTAVAISFQVVLVVGNAHVIAPQNVSAAVSYNCIRCITAAMAIQLTVSVPGPLDASTADRLAALWAKIRTFSQHLSSLSLAQIRARLAEYEREIIAIVRPSTSSASAPAAGGGASGAPSSGGVLATPPASVSATSTGTEGGSAVASAPAGDPTSSAGESSTPSSTPSSSAAPSTAPSAASSSSG
jgi:putative peptide zinc metalloprotease protein